MRWLLVAVLLFVLGGYLAYRNALRLLCVESGEVRAGALVVLGGDPVGRPDRAAELFKNKDAPIVFVSGGGDNEDVVAVLKHRGVPASAIRAEDKSTTTMENAEFTVKLLRQAQIKDAIIVTSWYHSRRAVSCFIKAAPEIRFHSRPVYSGLDRREWSYNGIGVHIRHEFAKMAVYWVWHGVSPFAFRSAKDNRGRDAIPSASNSCPPCLSPSASFRMGPGWMVPRLCFPEFRPVYPETSTEFCS